MWIPLTFGAKSGLENGSIKINLIACYQSSVHMLNGALAGRDGCSCLQQHTAHRLSVIERATPVSIEKSNVPPDITRATPKFTHLDDRDEPKISHIKRYGRLCLHKQRSASKKAPSFEPGQQYRFAKPTRTSRRLPRSLQGDLSVVDILVVITVDRGPATDRHRGVVVIVMRPLAS